MCVCVCVCVFPLFFFSLLSVLFFYSLSLSMSLSLSLSVSLPLSLSLWVALQAACRCKMQTHVGEASGLICGERVEPPSCMVHSQGKRGRDNRPLPRPRLCHESACLHQTHVGRMKWKLKRPCGPCCISSTCLGFMKQK